MIPPESSPAPRAHSGNPREQILAPTPDNLALLAKQLQAGQLIGVPTETVYGLAAHALDPAACRAIFTVKGRPWVDPLIVHIPSVASAASWVVWNAEATLLAEAFWPGPLTMVLPSRGVIPPVVTAGGDSVALRMPSHPIFQALMAVCAIPLAAPSANPFGYVSPTTAAHVRDSLGERVPWILDGGDCSVGIESTIVDLRNPRSPVVLRPGAITPEQIAAVLQRTCRLASRAQSQETIMPGSLERHYSPRTPLVLVPHGGVPEKPLPPEVALLLYRRPEKDSAWSSHRAVFWLTEDGDPEEAARHLFALLRKLDAGSWRHVWVESPPETPAHVALLDRLRRAATRS